MFASSTELGITVFIGAKLGVYIAAGVALRRAYPETRAAAWIIGTVRLVAGLAAGFLYFSIWSRFSSWLPESMHGPISFVVGLGVVSLIIWSAVIAAFCDPRWHTPVRTLSWASAGAALSLLIDGIGFMLAMPKFGMC